MDIANTQNVKIADTYISALDLSVYIADKCINDNHPISNLQMQKILFYIQRYCLQEENMPAFYDDFEAWQFGPVVPSVYYKYRPCIASPIDKLCLFGDNVVEITSKVKSVLGHIMYMVDAIIEEKRRLEPWDMVKETHKKGGAWETIYDNGNGNHHIISRQLICQLG